LNPIADALVATHKELEERTKSGLAQATVRAAEAPAKAEKPIDVASTSHLRDLAASAARIFGWDKPLSGPAVQFNQLCITQEQLEQIRQLRAVPEPEQLQERKKMSVENTTYAFQNAATTGVGLTQFFSEVVALGTTKVLSTSVSASPYCWRHEIRCSASFCLGPTTCHDPDPSLD